MSEKNGYASAGVLSYMGFETVCDQDSRYRVMQTNTVPYYHASHLLITFGDNKYVGSAFPVLRSAKYLVLATSGHCVWAAGSFATEIEVTPACNEQEKPYGTITAAGSELRASAGWQTGGINRAEFDYGAILLPADLEVSPLPLAVLSDDDLENRIISNCGYPADKPYGTMWWCGGPIEAVEERMIRYMADTFGGQSGSPIYTWTADNLNKAVGIHGYGGCPNGAVRITAAVVADYEKWADS